MQSAWTRKGYVVLYYILPFGAFGLFWGVKQTNRYLSVAFSGLKIGMEFTSKNVFSSPVHHRKNAVSVYLLLMQS